MPVGAFGGRTEIMEALAPTGPVYQAGTLSGNPIAVNAGLANLNGLQTDHTLYPKLFAKTQQLTEGLQHALIKRRSVYYESGRFDVWLFFKNGEHQVTNYKQVMNCDIPRFNRFPFDARSRNIFAPPLYEAGFLSCTHTDQDITETIAATKSAFKSPVNIKEKRYSTYPSNKNKKELTMQAFSFNTTKSIINQSGALKQIAIFANNII